MSYTNVLRQLGAANGENAALRAEVERLREALKSVEANSGYVCPDIGTRHTKSMEDCIVRMREIARAALASDGGQS